MAPPRRDRILEALRRGEGAVEQLAGQLGVSLATVRRDLAALAAEGVVARTYGGATLLPGGGEPSLGQRALLARTEKHRIAEAIARELVGLRMLYLDAGTTVGALAERMALQSGPFAGVTVVTHALSVANRLSEVEGIELIVLGGTLRRSSQGMLGPLTEQALASFRFDAAVLGCDAAAPGFGLGETTLVQVRLKEQVMRRAARVLVAADASKFVERGTPYWAALPPGALLVTEAMPPSVRAAFAAAGLELLLA